jgi:hypothetical protein
MMQILIEASGLIIASAILWAGKEIHNAGKQIGRVSRAVESLDRRVGDLERMFESSGIRKSERWGSLDDRDEEGSGPRSGGG